MARASAFVTGYLRRAWHCRERGHDTLTRIFSGRVTLIGCSCGAIFWQRHPNFKIKTNSVSPQEHRP